jgi:hypothetical protein
MTSQVPPNSGALLLRQVGEVLYGASWQLAMSEKISVSDRSLRRWAAGQDPIPPGVWRDIQIELRSRWLTEKYLDEQITPMLGATRLHPMPNTDPLPDNWGLHFTLATSRGRPVRCFIRREVLDDRVSYNPMKNVLDYFQKHAGIFYKAAQRKFDEGDADGHLISIGNTDVEGEDLPDVRGSWRAPLLSQAPDRYIVKYSTGDGIWPMHPFQSSKEALAYVRELFDKHGEEGADVELYLNDGPLYGNRRLRQWYRGMVDLD